LNQHFATKKHSCNAKEQTSTREMAEFFRGIKDVSVIRAETLLTEFVIEHNLLTAWIMTHRPTDTGLQRSVFVSDRVTKQALVATAAGRPLSIKCNKNFRPVISCSYSEGMLLQCLENRLVSSR